MDHSAPKKEAYSCDKGNYKGYYKMRQDSNVRLQYLSETWFRNKTCLDVGCNDGQFCIAIAESYNPSFILGIDPDFVLIDSAQSRLKRLVYSHQTTAKTSTSTIVEKEEASRAATTAAKAPALRMGFLPRALAVKMPIAKRIAPTTNERGPSMIEPKKEVVPVKSTFPFNIAFKARDIFDVSCTLNSQLEGKYDVVTCFSVTKWIHLNGGDAKLLEFFCKLYSLVHQGGRVVIEYQPWKSYENNKNTSEVTKANFPAILIKPELFEWILCDLVGFEIEFRLGTPLEQAKGFNRPILVLRRPVNAHANGNEGDNRKAWDNIGSFDDLCSIVRKRIKRGTTTGPISVTVKANSTVGQGNNADNASGKRGSGAHGQLQKKRKV